MDRLKILRKELKITQEELGKTLGISKAAVSKIENGFALLTERNINIICKEYNVNYAWLVNGDGEMFSTITKTLIDRLADQYELSQEKKELVERILALPDEEINRFTMAIFGFPFIKKD